MDTECNNYLNSEVNLTKQVKKKKKPDKKVGF